MDLMFNFDSLKLWFYSGPFKESAIRAWLSGCNKLSTLSEEGYAWRNDVYI